MMKRAKKFLSVFILLLVLPVNAAGAARDPQECLALINEAVASGDTHFFKELVDVDGILQSALAAFLAEIRKPENAFALPPMLALMISRAGDSQSLESIRGLLLNEARAFVLNGVENGSFAGKNFPAGKREGFLAPLFANASTGRKEIRDIGAAEKNGDYFLAPFIVHDYGNGNDYPVVGKFAMTPQGARLCGIENFDQLFIQIRREMAEQ